MQSWRDKHKEAHKTLSQYRCMRQQITSFNVLKISGGEAWLTRTAISRIAIVDAVQMSALVPTAELKQPGQFVCSLIVVSMLFVARGLAHNVVTFRTKRINCGTIL